MSGTGRVVCQPAERTDRLLLTGVTQHKPGPGWCPAGVEILNPLAGRAVCSIESQSCLYSQTVNTNNN